ncbi:MAG: LarC family nickel insertion protein, partial [Planctomycetota bacterium]
ERFEVLQAGAPAEGQSGQVHAQAHGHHHGHAHHHHQHHAHGHAHADDHAHTHDHHHDHTHDHHHDQHRSLSRIEELICAAGLEAAVEARALRMFRRLGAVEAAAHGIPVERVHFHEVGAVDSIVDIVAAALCIERLAPARVQCTPVCVGHGSIRIAHGTVPVPAPATEALLHGMPTSTTGPAGEWTTPTGALILDELQPDFASVDAVYSASAFGAGGKDTPGRVNALRLRSGRPTGATVPVDGLLCDEVAVLSCTIDDSPGELLGADLIDRLLAAGARDALLIPVIMKRGRPGQRLEVLAEPRLAEALAGLILSETSSIGLRIHREQRRMLPREACSVDTPWGAVAAKRVTLPDGSTRTRPEYQACAELARQTGVPVQRIHAAAAQ